MSIRTVTGQVGKVATEGAIILDTVVLGVTGSPLVTAGALIFRAVDTEMACGMTLKATSLCSRNRFWTQVGILRCNSYRIGGGVSLMKHGT